MRSTGAGCIHKSCAQHIGVDQAPDTWCMDTDLGRQAPWEAIAARVRAVGALSPEALVRAAGINGPRREAAERVLSLTYDGPTLVGLPSVPRLKFAAGCAAGSGLRFWSR